MSHASEFMGKEPVHKLLMRFALPAMFSSFVNCLYNIVDRLYIGRGAGSDAMAGLALTFPYMIILASFGMMIGQGSAAIVSLFLGEKRYQDANKVLGQAMAMFLLFIITIQALGLIFLDKTLILFGGTEAAIPYAHQYLVIILWGNLFQHISFGMSNVMRAEGSSMQAMGTVILGAVTNIILDPIFIFGFKMGIRGAAWATIISMMLSSAWVIRHFLTKSVLRLQFRYIRIYPHLFGRVLAIGMAPCIMQIIHSLVVIAYNHSFLRFSQNQAQSTIGIAAFGILNGVLMIMLTPSFGINMGVQPIIGFNTGARLFDRVRQAFKLAVGLATAICFVCALMMFFGAPLIAKCFTGDAVLIQESIYALRVAAVGFTGIGIGIITGTYYQSVGRASIAIFFSGLRQCFLLLPLLLLLPRYMGYNGIWWAGPASDILSGALALCFFLHELHSLRRKAAEFSAPVQ